MFIWMLLGLFKDAFSNGSTRQHQMEGRLGVKDSETVEAIVVYMHF